jgi:integrase
MKAYLVAINSKYIHPAMGVFSLVSNSNYPVIYDEFTIKDKKEKIINAILEKEYDVLGFSVYIWNATLIKEILIDLKNKGFNKPIFIGGPETYFKSELYLKEYNVSYSINNEGEESFNELMDYLSGIISIEEVSNLYYLKDNTLTFTYTKLPDINKIKTDLTLIKDFKNRIVYLESSRGCPFKCSYCMASLEDKVRFFPIEKVKTEIKFLLDNNCRVIKFLDRSFNVNKEYMLDILRFIKDNDNGITVFQFEIVGDLLSKDIIDYINQNIRKGMLRFEIGIQSLNDMTTKAVCRRQDFDKLKTNIQLLKDTVTLHLDLIAGLPYENLSSFKKSFNDSYLLMGEELQLGFLKELKGTKISNEKDDHDYDFDINPPYEIISNKYLNKEELDIIRKVERALEKYHNKGCYKNSMEYLFIKNNLDPFDTFLKLTNQSNKELKYLNDDESFSYLFHTLKDGLNEKTIKDILIVLKMILKFGVKNNMLKYNQIEIKFPTNHEKKVIEVLSRDNQKRLMNYLNNNFTFKNLGIIICLSTGLRIGELCALRWCDIDINESVIKVRHTIQRIYFVDNKDNKYTKVFVDSPKTKESIRDIPLSSSLIKILKPLMKVVRSEYYVLTNDENPIEPRTYRNYYKRLLAKIGIPDIKFHGLRHSFATRCIEANSDYKTVSVILGHSSISTTLNLYVHPNNEQKKRCIDKMLKSL